MNLGVCCHAALGPCGATIEESFCPRRLAAAGAPTRSKILEIIHPVEFRSVVMPPVPKKKRSTYFNPHIKDTVTLRSL